MEEVSGIGSLIVNQLKTVQNMQPAASRPTGVPPVDEVKISKSQGSREIIQSYIISTARYDFNVYEKRILYQLVRFAQNQIEGIAFKDNIHKIDHSLTGSIQLLFPITDFRTGKDDKNNRRIKTALVALSRKTFTYQDENSWGHISLIANPHIWNEKGYSWVSFIVDEKVWDAILDFSKGYSKFYFDVAFSLESVYSMRFYELLGSQEKTICYSIDEIRRIFQLDGIEKDGKKVGEKYKNTNDLIRKVIEPAKAELDKKSPMTFTYELIRKGRKITSVAFTPVTQKKKLQPKAEFHRQVLKYGSAAVLNRHEMRVLEEVGFSRRGIDNNLGILMEAKKVMDDFLMEIVLLQGQSREKSNPCGWFIEALKGKVGDLKSRRKKL